MNPECSVLIGLGLSCNETLKELKVRIHYPKFLNLTFSKWFKSIRIADEKWRHLRKTLTKLIVAAWRDSAMSFIARKTRKFHP